jgi:site-specific DNA-methyltransferase (adenine-specific)
MEDIKTIELNSYSNKIYNEDCISGLNKYIPDESIDLIITDPPYDVNYGNKSAELEKIGKAGDKQKARDKHFIDSFKDYDALSSELFRVLKTNSHCYLFCGDKQITKWSEAMTKVGFKNPQILVWIKNITTFDMTMGHKFPENKEFILFFQKGWKKLNGYNIERHLFRSSLFFDSNGDTNTHSCAKPINLISFLTKLSSQENDLCLDPFSGGGSHLVSFKRTNRKYVGFEISQEYYKIILKKLEYENKQNKLEDWFNDTTIKN